MKRVLTIWLVTAASAMGQSTVTGSKTMQGGWDASGATFTKPAKSGATLPATCGAGEFFFSTTAAAGQNLYLCQPANTWSQIAGGGSGGGSGGGVSLIFDGSTVLSTETMSAWSCSGGACATNWTVPAGVNWVAVELWAGGGPGLGAGSSGGGAGGAGGGYARRICSVTPGASIPVAVGQGGVSGSGFGAGVTPGGNSNFGACIGATAGAIVNGYAYSSPPGVMSLNGVNAPPGPWLLNNGYWSSFVNDPTGADVSSGYNAVREDQGGWAAAGYLGGTGAGLSAGAAIGGGGGGGGGASQSPTAGAAGTSVLGGAGGMGGSSASACTNGSIPGGGGGGAYIPASGNTSGCNGARGEVRVFYLR